VKKYLREHFYYNKCQHYSVITSDSLHRLHAIFAANYAYL